MILLSMSATRTSRSVSSKAGSSARHWRLRTVHDQTADEWGILLRNLFSLGDLSFERRRWHHHRQCCAAARFHAGRHVAAVFPPRADVRHVGNGHRARRSCTTIPREVGADRIVNGVAAFQQYGGPCVVVDLGTAITFDAVSANAEYLGGVICPGIGMSVARSVQPYGAASPG